MKHFTGFQKDWRRNKGNWRNPGKWKGKNEIEYAGHLLKRITSSFIAEVNADFYQSRKGNWRTRSGIAFPWLL